MQEKAQKSGVFLGSSVSGAHCLLLHNHIRALISGVLFQPWMSHARMCTLSPLVSCNLRKPPTRLFATASYVLSSPTVSASVAAAAVAASPVSSRIGILSWYLGMIQTRPIITKSIIAVTIFTAAGIFSQLPHRQANILTLRSLLEVHTQILRSRLPKVHFDFPTIVHHRNHSSNHPSSPHLVSGSRLCPTSSRRPSPQSQYQACHHGILE